MYSTYQTTKLSLPDSVMISIESLSFSLFRKTRHMKNMPASEDYHWLSRLAALLGRWQARISRLGL
jgi:hypothetical protein